MARNLEMPGSARRGRPPAGPRRDPPAEGRERSRASSGRSIEGSYVVSLKRNKAGFQADIGCQRSLQASRLMLGRRANQAPALLGMLFALCGQGHAEASMRAVEDAAGLHVDPGCQRARDILLKAEMLGENLRKLLVDWPGLWHLGVSARSLAPTLRILKLFPSALFPLMDMRKPGGGRIEYVRSRISPLDSRLEEEVAVMLLGSSEAGNRIRLGLDAFREWVRETLRDRSEGEDGYSLAVICDDLLGRPDLASLGKTELPLLSDRSQNDLDAIERALEKDRSGDFPGAPSLDGSPCEVGAVARRLNAPLVAEVKAAYGTGLLCRLLARLVDSLEIAGEIQQSLAELPRTVEPGAGTEATSATGFAAVETARGVLCHRVEIHQGIIHRYQIVAPTEWNLHPDGVLVTGLEALDNFPAAVMADIGLEKLARLSVEIMDPCVTYQLSLDPSLLIRPVPARERGL